MLRIIVKTCDYVEADNVGGGIVESVKSFDVEAPTREGPFARAAEIEAGTPIGSSDGLECPPDRKPLTLHLTPREFAAVNEAILLVNIRDGSFPVEQAIAEICRRFVARENEFEFDDPCEHYGEAAE